VYGSQPLRRFGVDNDITFAGLASWYATSWREVGNCNLYGKQSLLAHTVTQIGTFVACRVRGCRSCSDRPRELPGDPSLGCAGSLFTQLSHSCHTTREVSHDHRHHSDNIKIFIVLKMCILSSTFARTVGGAQERGQRIGQSSGPQADRCRRRRRRRRHLHGGAEPMGRASDRQRCPHSTGATHATHTRSSA
jgi:hypothetical protein